MGSLRSCRRKGSVGVAASGSMVVPRNGRSALADEEVEIGALVGLQDMVDVELGVAAARMGRRRLPSGAPAVELVRLHVQVQGARLHVEGDEVAVLDQRQ